MNEEEKKAIAKIERQIVAGEGERAIGIPVYISDLKTLLNLIEKKDRQIDLMAEELVGYPIVDMEEDETLVFADKEEVKQYYKYKASDIMIK